MKQSASIRGSLPVPRRSGICALFALSGLMVFFFLPPAAAPRPFARAKDKKQPAMTRLHVQVTAGPDNQPVPDASVYVKYPVNPKSPKSKDIELNLKTSQKGIAESPNVPQGMILIQVIAPGWKTFGQWFDVE